MRQARTSAAESASQPASLAGLAPRNRPAAKAAESAANLAAGGAISPRLSTRTKDHLNLALGPWRAFEVFRNHGLHAADAGTLP